MLIKTSDGEVLGGVITNHSMTIYEACDLAGIDAGHSEYNDYDIDDLIGLTPTFMQPSAK